MSKRKEDSYMKVLVLGGGFDQIALIKELRSRGNIVYLVDFLENPPARRYADCHWQISTLDENAVYELAKKERVELIATACTDQALMTVASISEKMGLPCYISAQTARNVTNKAFMKKKFIESGIPTAKCSVLKNLKDLDKFKVQELSFPLVVKPCDCNSSKGVVKVESYAELELAVIHAFELSRGRSVIVEEFKAGEEISIDVWKDAEDTKILSVTKTRKLKENRDNFTIYQSQYPIELSQTLVKKIHDLASEICKAFELENCPLLIQGILHGDNISVVEFSARMGGGSKYKLIEYMANVDIMKIYVNRILGDEEQIVRPIWSNSKIELNYVYGYNGIFKKLIGFDEYLRSSKIKELFQYKESGAEIKHRATSSDRIAGFLLEESDEYKLEKLRKEIVDNVDVLNENGISMMYKKCFYEA